MEQGATAVENPYLLTKPEHRECWEHGRQFGTAVYAVMRKEAKRHMES